MRARVRACVRARMRACVCMCALTHTNARTCTHLSLLICVKQRHTEINRQEEGSSARTSRSDKEHLNEMSARIALYIKAAFSIFRVDLRLVKFLSN